MRTVKPEKLTIEAFAPFGQFYNFAQPDGYPLCGAIHTFYPDRIVGDSNHRLGFSTLAVRRPERMIITQQEYHSTTWEMIMPLDDDMILHVGPASNGAPVGDHAKVFLVPKNTLVKLNAAIWHFCPMPANKDVLNMLIVLPECTYLHDCVVADLPEDQQFEIVL